MNIVNKKTETKQVIYFTDCSLISLEEQFQLKMIYDSKWLKEWFDYLLVDSIAAEDQSIIERSRQILVKNAHDWNEHELSMYFIGPILSLVNFSTPQFNLFAQRSLAAMINNIELKGKPDGLIAMGQRKPKLPLFCLHEYKKDSEYGGEPAGQVLAAMLAAQAQNKVILGEYTIPIYGCYVIGRLWYFMVLEGQEYAISEGYVATRTSELFTIVKLLKGLKTMLLKQVSELKL